jgi:ferredoxin
VATTVERLGHRNSQDPRGHLKHQLDRYPLGAPGGQLIDDILKTLYTADEAELAGRLPLGFSTLSQLSRQLKLPEDALRTKLESLADKGLVLDLNIGSEVKYALPPTLVGLFEFSMMRVRDDIDQRQLARLFHRYLVEEPEYFSRIRDNRTTPFRTLIHEDTIPSDYAEILDYERATKLVERETLVAVGLCHCRHVAHHLGRECRVFCLDSCLSFGSIADYLIRHRLARRIDSRQTLTLLGESRRQGMVHIGDNVQNQPNFLCNCCPCCCQVLNSFKHFDFLGNVFSSNFEATIVASRCAGCDRCRSACPVDAIRVREVTGESGGARGKALAEVDESVCLGCGVCVAACKVDAVRMKPRAQKRIVPENTIARTLMMAIENGTLQNLLTDRHASLPSAAINTLIATITRLPPVKQLLAREALKSRFVDFLVSRARA